MTRLVGLMFKADREAARCIARAIQTADYGGRDVRFVICNDRAADDGRPVCRQSDFSDMEFVVSIGGDGTFLRSARFARELGVPLYGINAGRLGFLAAGHPRNAASDLEKILAGSYSTMKRSPIKGLIRRGDAVLQELYALNEITITKGTVARPVDLLVTAGSDSLYRFVADGIIVSTPTGSTAYSLSAGGPVIHPDVRCLLVVPICPHSLYPRPVILGEGERVGVEPKGEVDDVILSGDGHLDFRLTASDRVELSLDTERPVEVIKLGDGSYYEVLQQKLNWRDGQGNGSS